jgi:Flp pilus assembly pilin Flp
VIVMERQQRQQHQQSLQHRTHLPVDDEDGSLVTEYGLLAVVAATVAGVLIQWATGGAVVNLFNALVDRARELVGA